MSEFAPITLKEFYDKIPDISNKKLDFYTEELGKIAPASFNENLGNIIVDAKISKNCREMPTMTPDKMREEVLKGLRDVIRYEIDHLDEEKPLYWDIVIAV